MRDKRKELADKPTNWLTDLTAQEMIIDILALKNLNTIQHFKITLQDVIYIL